MGFPIEKIANASKWLLAVLLTCGLLAITQLQSSAPAQERVSLVGTTWSGTDSDGDHYVFTFEDGGTAAYKSPTGSFRNGKWYQFNNAVYFEMNDHFSDYLGEINGRSIQGKAWNKQRRTWQWKLTREN